MKLDRRSFLETAAMAAPAIPSGSSGSGPYHLIEQKLNRDFQTSNPGTEYFFFGNGWILAAVQSVGRPEEGTHCGLALMPAEHFGRKMSTLLFSPSSGFRQTRLTVMAEGKSYTPEPGAASVSWAYPDGIPTVTIEWTAGNLAIIERLYCASGVPALIRSVEIRNGGGANIEPRLVAYLQPNTMCLDEYSVDRERGTLTATGYQRLDLFAEGGAIQAADRALLIGFGKLAPGSAGRTDLVLTLNFPREQFEATGVEAARADTGAYWRGCASIRTGHAGLDHLFHAARTGVRAAVARSGKMDGGIWQYNLEWVRDQTMVSMGATVAGAEDVARALLDRILTRSVSDDGETVEASRTRSPADMELDQNGELLYGLWTDWVWTGDDTLIRQHWKRIRAVADLVLQPVYRDPAVGLLKNTREFWERDRNFGVREGYESSYQFWNILGLAKAAEMAEQMGEDASAGRWREASRLMRTSFLEHPRFALVAGGRLIKRRLADGTVQTTFVPPNPKSMSPEMPLGNEPVSYCDPDSTEVLPIVYGLVDPKSDLARNTLAFVEKLWNQRWTAGGYARYDVSSEPDSPGPWPFATLFIARAYMEAGDSGKAWRALNWLLNVQGGRGGAWFEFFGPQPSPAFSSLGFVPWTWGELLMFFSSHLLGIRPQRDRLIICPRLLSGLARVKAGVRLHRRRFQLTVERGNAPGLAWVDGKRVPMVDGAIRISFPEEGAEIRVSV